MTINLILDILILSILLILYNILSNYNYFLLIYLLLSFYNVVIFIFTLKYNRKEITTIFIFLFFSIIINYISYYYIYDPNPIFCFVSYYIFYPNFVKSILIVLLHTFFLSKFPCKDSDECFFDFEKKSFVQNYIFLKLNKKPPRYYFLSNFFLFMTGSKFIFIIILISFLLLYIIDVILFLNRIRLWVYYNNKEKTLPIASSRNTTFFIASTVVNMEGTINNYIIEMKKLISYLGEENVIVSFLENGDSKDNTRYFLKDFQKYLNKKNVTNRFLLKHEIDDPRKKLETYEFLSPLRIKYYAKLRNRCLDFLYELPNIDFNNTKIIFFNDIIFKYEDIINLLSTNNEDYDAVCGLDFYDCFYDTWVSIDLDGNSLKHRFPYFINKEAQDLVVNHKPVRVFSCWNGVMAFTASPLKNKAIKFRSQKKSKYKINNSEYCGYDSECTYFHIDLFSLGYTKKFINPDVRFAYEYEYYYKRKYFYPAAIEVNHYFEYYAESFKEKRNKYMSDYKSKDIKFNKMVYKWYSNNQIKKKKIK